MPAKRSASVVTQAPSSDSGRSAHRACAYCREHRIKCIPVKDETRCRKCLDQNIACDKSSAAPKDVRPRRRQMFKSRNNLQFQGSESSYLGSSSLALLSWKYSPQIPNIIDQLRNIDDKHDSIRGSVGGIEQDGLFISSKTNDGRGEKRPLLSVDLEQAKLLNDLGIQTVLSSLYETCRDRIIPLFPVISVSESLLADKASDDHLHKYVSVDPHAGSSSPLPHIVRMIHCALAAQSRQVPMEIRQGVMARLRSLLPASEMSGMLGRKVLGSAQVLLLLSMCDELNGNGADPLQAIENVWQNVGGAVRIGFAMALHRNISTSHIPYFQMNRRLRVWGACVAMDRWQAVRLGRGPAIDLAYCDAPLPRSFADGIREGETKGPDGNAIFPCFRFLKEFTSLSILLGRAHRLIGTPTGLQAAEDLQLYMLQVDIDIWQAQLPTTWQYSTNVVLRQAPSLLNLFTVTLEFTLQRNFLWPTTPIPANITFRPPRERWTNLCQKAENAIYWLNSPDGAFYLDVWSITVYSAFCCVIVLHKAVMETNDSHHRWLLSIANDVIQNWAQQAMDDRVRSQLASLSGVLLTSTTESRAVVAATSSATFQENVPNTSTSTIPAVTETDDLMNFFAFDNLDASWFEDLGLPDNGT